MSDYKKYLEILRDPKYIELYNYYSKETMMGILGVDRQENPHSSFLRWLLDIHEGHGYGDMAMRRFLETVCLFRDEVYEDTQKNLWENEDNLLNINNADILDEIRYGRYEIVHQSIANETVLKGQRRADIFAVLALRMQRTSETKYLVVLIENKVESVEHDHQTVKYVEAVKQSQNRDLKIDWMNEKETIAEDSLKLYVFLNAYPTSKIEEALDEEKQQPQLAESKEFITVNYQYLLDEIFEPLSNLTDNVEIQRRMKDYIRCLGQAKITSITSGDDTKESKKDDKEYLIMAVSGREKELAVSLWKEHSEVIYPILKSIFQEDKFLLNENDRDFWISYSNLLRLIEQKEMIGENVQVSWEEVQKMIGDANRATKHKYTFHDKTYESYQSVGNNIGALCRDIIKDITKDEKDIEQWISELRKKSKKCRIAWLGNAIFSEADVLKKIREPDDDGLCRLSVKRYNDEKQRTDDFLAFTVLKDGKEVYVDKCWSIAYMEKMIKFLDKEYGSKYEEKEVLENERKM